jgi:hypothetical protein
VTQNLCRLLELPGIAWNAHRPLSVTGTGQWETQFAAIQGLQQGSRPHRTAPTAGWPIASTPRRNPARTARLWAATGDVVALRIIAIARLGELDCDRLREGALRYLAEIKETGTQAKGD